MERRETPKRLFALDENFPDPLIQGLRIAFEDFAELVSLRDIGEDVLEVDDWEVLLRLHQHERPWDGLITNDEAMLALPKEMTVLDQTGLTLVVVKGQGHSAIRATGLLLCHLQHICHQTDPRRAQVWRFTTKQKDAESAAPFLEQIAHRENLTVNQLMAKYRVPVADLARRGGKPA